MLSAKCKPIPPYDQEEIKEIKSLFHEGLKDTCWEWNGRRTPDNYGIYREFLAHRIVRHLYFGDVTPSDYVLHKCDNPPCVNPWHTFKGTLADNNRDRHNKGRDVMPTVRALGHKNGRAKLDSQQVAEIRKRHIQGEPQRKLAREFGVSGMSIWAIVHNLYWKHVKPHVAEDTSY